MAALCLGFDSKKIHVLLYLVAYYGLQISIDFTTP